MDNLNKIFKSVLEADRAAVVICDLEHKIIIQFLCENGQKREAR